MLHARREPAADAAATASEGRAFSLLLADREVRAAVLAAVAGLLFISASITVEVFYVRDVVHAGGFGYALVISGWTAGMILGAIAAAPRVTTALAAGAMIALAVQGAGMAAASLWAVLPWVIAGFAVGGVGHGVKNVLMRTLIQTRVPAEQHGRAFAAYGAARNAAELGALGLGGVMVGAIGAQPALLIAGLGPVVAALVALAATTYQPILMYSRRHGRGVAASLPPARGPSPALEAAERARPQ
jgi:hypothetical protein